MKYLVKELHFDMGPDVKDILYVLKCLRRASSVAVSCEMLHTLHAVYANTLCDVRMLCATHIFAQCVA